MSIPSDHIDRIVRGSASYLVQKVYLSSYLDPVCLERRQHERTLDGFVIAVAVGLLVRPQYSGGGAVVVKDEPGDPWPEVCQQHPERGPVAAEVGNGTR